METRYDLRLFDSMPGVEHHVSSEDLHHDFEMAVEGAIELYRKERDCEGLTSEHPGIHAVFVAFRAYPLIALQLCRS